MALITQSYPADLEATLLQLGLATSTLSFSEAEALDGEELLPIELLECGTTPAGGLDHEELLGVELLEFRYFRNELFWQELDTILVGLGLQQDPTTNQAAPAFGP